jgi:hypothetical protein
MNNQFLYIFLILFVFLLTSFVGIYGSGPIILLNKETHNYGVIEYGSNGECEFIVSNIGNKDLIITNVKTSCGCTVVKYPIEPIISGGESKIKVKYDTKRPGSINKKITIFSNDPNQPEKHIYIKGVVNELKGS